MTVHVETAKDFRLAVQAEADEIAHLPGWIVSNAEDGALPGNPLDDFEAVQAIRLRVKQGRLVHDSNRLKPDERMRG